MKQKTEAKEMTSEISLKHSRQIAYASETAANSSGTDAFAGGAYAQHPKK